MPERLPEGLRSQPEAILISKDAHDVLEVLKFELEFFQSGGYGRAVRSKAGR